MFTAGIITSGILGIVTLLTGNVVYVMIMGIFMAALLYFRHTRQSPDWINNLVLGALLINLIGSSLNLFHFIDIFDLISHAITVAAAVLLIHVALKKHLAVSHALVYGIILILAGVAVGAWWEIVEWFWDLVQPHNLIKGVRDTVFDLVADTLGAILASILIYRREKIPLHSDNLSSTRRVE